MLETQILPEVRFGQKLKISHTQIGGQTSREAPSPEKFEMFLT